jgi:hypothetical protein
MAARLADALQALEWTPREGYSDGYPYCLTGMVDGDDGQAVIDAFAPLVAACVDATSTVAFVADLGAALAARVNDAQNIAAWRLLLFTHVDDPRGHWPLVGILTAWPGVVSQHLAAALCRAIGDANLEETIKGILPRIPTARLDSEFVARECMHTFRHYRRCIDTGLRVLERLSTPTLDLVGDALVEKVSSCSTNRKLLRRVERLVARVEAPGGAAFKRHRAAAGV